MIQERKISFRTFVLEIKKRPVPDSCLIIFSGGTDTDSKGWESATGDRKKFEDNFKFMWNPFDAPSNKKGEYVVKFSTEERLNKFSDWLEKEIKRFGGIIDKLL